MLPAPHTSPADGSSPRGFEPRPVKNEHRVPRDDERVGTQSPHRREGRVELGGVLNLKDLKLQPQYMGGGCTPSLGKLSAPLLLSRIIRWIDVGRCVRTDAVDLDNGFLLGPNEVRRPCWANDKAPGRIRL